MNRLLSKAGSTVTPTRPRSRLEHTAIVVAGVGRRVLFWNTRSSPAWVVMSIRPSGVKATPVGEGIAATS